MKYQTLITICVVLIILGIYFLNREKLKKLSNNAQTFDLIIQFDSSHYIEISKKDCFQQLADWYKYGKYSFRGFCTLNKEELEIFIINNLKLNKENFKVIKGNPSLYIPS